MTKIGVWLILVLAMLWAGSGWAASKERACKDRCWKETNKIKNAAQRAKARQACFDRCRR